MLRFLSVSFASLGVLFFVGCGGEDSDLPPLVPVTGQVTLDGKPLTGASVTFMPAGETAGMGASGVTDDNGKYELSTLHRSNGASPGDYRVLISKFVMPDGTPYPANADVSPMDAGANELLPPRFSDPEASTLTANVPPDGGTIDLKVTSK